MMRSPVRPSSTASARTTSVGGVGSAPSKPPSTGNAGIRGRLFLARIAAAHVQAARAEGRTEVTQAVAEVIGNTEWNDWPVSTSGQHYVRGYETI